MRAKEFINEEVNPDIYHSDFKHELEIHGYRYTAETDNNSGYGNQLIIKVYDGNEEIANAEFIEEPHDKALISANTWVSEEYQGQHIATNMYAYAKMLGNDIIPSWNQTDAGERMWRSWNQSGQSKHILPKGHKGFRELDESGGMFNKVLTHETSPKNANLISQNGFKITQVGVFFNTQGTNYSGGEYGGVMIKAQITGAKDGILNLEDDDNLPDDLGEFDDAEEIARYARAKGYWAWTDGMQFVVLEPGHIRVL